jgi:hypothetical protein
MPAQQQTEAEAFVEECREELPPPSPVACERCEIDHPWRECPTEGEER